jgi:hypothetical protein
MLHEEKDFLLDKLGRIRMKVVVFFIFLEQVMLIAHRESVKRSDLRKFYSKTTLFW